MPFDNLQQLIDAVENLQGINALKVDGTNSMLADLDAGNFKVVNVSDATDATDATNLQQVQSEISSAISNLTTSLVPTGSIVMTGRPTPPSGWLICDGSEVSRTTYANLFSAIGGYFGSGNGSTTFNLPDMRRRIGIGKGDSDSLGSNDGLVYSSRSLTHNHSIPKHYHGFSLTAAGQSLDVANRSVTVNATNSQHAHGFSLSATGGDHSHTYTYRDSVYPGGSGGFSGTWRQVSTANTGGTGAHSHTISGSIGNGASNSTDGHHTHTASVNIDHTHNSSSVSGTIGSQAASGGVNGDNTMTSGSTINAPFVVVNYIIKV